MPGVGFQSLLRASWPSSLAVIDQSERQKTGLLCGFLAIFHFGTFAKVPENAEKPERMAKDRGRNRPYFRPQCNAIKRQAILGYLRQAAISPYVHNAGSIQCHL